MSKVTMIKNDAVITISIGSAFLQKVQKVLVQLISDKSEEEIEDYKKDLGPLGGVLTALKWIKKNNR